MALEGEKRRDYLRPSGWKEGSQTHGERDLKSRAVKKKSSVRGRGALYLLKEIPNKKGGGRSSIFAGVKKVKGPASCSEEGSPNFLDPEKR